MSTCVLAKKKDGSFLLVDTKEDILKHAQDEPELFEFPISINEGVTFIAECGRLCARFENEGEPFEIYLPLDVHGEDRHAK